MSSLYVNGAWREGSGDRFTSTDPATGQVIWEEYGASPSDVTSAIDAARNAFGAWSSRPIEERIEVLEAFTRVLESRKVELAGTICREVGRMRWDATGEVAAMIRKTAISIEAHRHRCPDVERDIAPAADPVNRRAVIGAVRYRPHGVCAVFGPYNFPVHVPNGHIVPALLAGNTVVFKPSELVPLTAQQMIALWHEAGLPPGVLNLVQGSGDTGEALADPRSIDGLFFTGSYRVGRILNKRFADEPGCILALELGGNNPLIVNEPGDLDAAVYMAVQSAFLTSGQRCTCASRLIVPRGREGDAFVDRLAAVARSIVCGAYTDDPEPFMGPVIHSEAADKLITAQRELLSAGAKAVVEMKRLASSGNAMLSPGIIDVTGAERDDRELFGPILQLIRVEDFDEAIREANSTSYGLSAGLICDDRDKYEAFYNRIRAGVVSWNRPTTGASSYAPFGGVGRSGNHRPAGYHAADYCSWPVASTEAETLKLPETLWPGITL